MVHVMNAIRDAVPRALTPTNILSAWKTSHLYPFKEGDPPYSKEKELAKFNELKKSSILLRLNPVEETDGEVTGVVNKPPVTDESSSSQEKSITGVINSSENLPIMRQLICQGLEPEPCDSSCDAMVGRGPLTAVYHGDFTEMGDTVKIISGKDGMPDRIVGTCEAPLFIAFDINDL